MYAGGFSVLAVDTPAARNSDRLTAFLSEIVKNEPVDQYFDRYPTIDAFREHAKVGVWGRQCWQPIDSGYNTTVKDFSDYDVFDTSPQSTVISVGYPMVNKGASIIISWEELREIAGNDHKVYDRLKQLRANCLKSVLKVCNEDIYAAAAAAGKIEPIPIIVDNSGTCGSLSQATDADWASTETASGSFAAQGISDMTTMMNTLWSHKSKPSVIMTTQDVHEFMEKELAADIRYSMGDLSEGKRGFEGLKFKGVPIKFDADCTAGVMYFLDNEHLYLAIDEDANFSFGEFRKPVDQECQVALFKLRWSLICDRRKAHGKLTGVVA